MNFNFGLLPHQDGLKKKNKKEILAENARRAVLEWIADRKNA
jgi:methylenetetrahydrofolate--tRNA-(uracil-5-)-methyltransferase